VVNPPTPVADDVTDLALDDTVSAPDDLRSSRWPPLETLRRIGWVALGLQLIGMLAFSTLEYHRFDLTIDFASYSQSWWAIAHGHLDPVDSFFVGATFWRNNTEFAMWPLALLYYVYPHSVDLLWVQDVVVVTTEAVTFGWILELITRARDRLQPSTGTALGALALFVLVVDPWAYETIAFDIHFPALAALFVVLTARNLWAGRTRRLWLWVPLALLTDALSGFYLLGVGISGVLAGGRTRRAGWAVGAAGLAWSIFATSIGGVAAGGRYLHLWYGYLVGPHPGRISLLSIVLGIFRHPGAVGHLLASRWQIAFLFVAVMGFAGAFTRWSLPVVLVVMVPSTINALPIFLRVAASFQTWPAIPFVLFGSLMIVLRLAQGGRAARRVGIAFVSAWLTVLVVVALYWVPNLGRDWITVTPRAAAQLARTAEAVPPYAEVIVSQGVAGRFSERRFGYAITEIDESFPVHSRTVVFVITPDLGVGEIPRVDADAAVHYVERRLDAQVLVARNGVYDLRWLPPRGDRSVTLP
jgi:hypothetical protein